MTSFKTNRRVERMTNPPDQRTSGTAAGLARIRRIGFLAALALMFFLANGFPVSGPAGRIVLVETAWAGTQNKLGIGLPAPDIDFRTVDGARRRLSEFHGKPIMLWFFASLCSSCTAATRAVAENLEDLQRSGMQIIQLKLYKNLGYPGPSTEEFAKTYAGGAYPSPGWIWGDASRTASFTYDPRGYPDIYFLIDERGVLRGIDGVPNATMNKILAFSRAYKGKATSENMK
jgi:hypothetical protein